MTAPLPYAEILAEWEGDIRQLLASGAGIRTIASHVGCSRDAAAKLRDHIRWGNPLPGNSAPEPQAVSGDEVEQAVHSSDHATLEPSELVRERIRKFQLKQKKSQQQTHRMRVDGPVGICHLGDPHVDDDGCDWPELGRTIEVIANTPGMYAGNVGDTVNNWVGRLQRLYAHQSTTEGEAFELAEWLLMSSDWAYVLLGNHDHWNQGATILRLIARDAKIRILESHEVRLEIESPQGVTRICARHDFRGQSQWNKVHAGAKRAKLRPWADVYVSGHRHQWGAYSEESHDGRSTLAIMVRGYKRHDDYGAASDLPADTLGASLTTIHDPGAPCPGDRIRLVHDPEEAAEVLTWLRKRRMA